MKGLGVDTVLVPFKNPNLYAALRVDKNHEIFGAQGQVIRFLVVFGISETYGGYN